MKKITSLFTLFLLLLGMSVQAQRIIGLDPVPTEKTLPENLTTGYYLLKQVNKVTNDYIHNKEAGYGFIRAQEESVGSKASSVGSTEPKTAIYIWYVEVIDKVKHHIKISTANKIASWHLPENAQRVKPLVAYDEGTTLECVMEKPNPLNGEQVGAPAAGSCFLRNLEKKAYVHFSGNDLGSWTDCNINSLYMVEFYKIPKESLKTIGQVEVNYTYYLNDVVIGKTKQKADIGGSYNAPRLNIGYLKYSYKNSDPVSVSNCNVDVLCTENLPFQKTESFANKEDLLNAKWYYMTIANQKYYLKHVDGATQIELNTRALDVVPEDNYKWCFVGNAYEGFKIYNKATGMAKVLSSSLKMEGTTGSGTHPIMTDESSIQVSTNNLRWDLTESENGSGNVSGSYWAQHGQSSHKMNNRENVLAFWTGGADGGSTFTFIEAPSDDKLIDNYKKINQAIVGYVGGYTVEQFNDLNGVTTAAALREFIAKNQTITIQPGGYYRLKNVGMKHMLSARVNSTDVASLQVNSDLTQLQTNIDFLWQFQGSGNQYQLRHLNLDRYVTNPGKSNLQGGAGADYEFVSLGDAQYAMKCVVNDETEYLFEFDNKTLGSSSSAGKNGAGSWYIKPVNKIQLDMNQVGTSPEYWSSLYLPFSVALPSGVEAYWGTCVAGHGGDDIGSLILKKLNVIPANTGVLLKGCQQNYQLDIIDDNTVLDNNCLRGTNKELPLFYSFDGQEASMKDSYFTLGYKSAMGVGFYHPLGKYLKANRAYIPLAVNPILVQGYRLVFEDDEMTGVDNVELNNNQANDVYYDLSGRRVLHPKKGVYVKNGKKVYVK